MPELPDVEVMRRTLERHARGHTLRRLVMPNPEMLDGVSLKTLRRHAEGHRITGTERIGKHLLVELDDGGYLALHFGMSGSLQPFASEGPAPPYTRLWLELEDERLAYVVPRKLGRVGYAEGPEQLRDEKHLGIDALDPKLDFKSFARMMKGKGMLKCWLMDQSQIAGVGNVYSDEVLYQARLNPHRHTEDLNETERRRLFTTLHRVLETAIERGADVERLPDDWLLPHRHADQPCPSCSGLLRHETLCGRSAYWCPQCQT